MRRVGRFSDHVDGRHDLRTGNHIPHVGGGVCGRVPHRQLDQFLLQHRADNIVRFRVFRVQIEHTGELR